MKIQKMTQSRTVGFLRYGKNLLRFARTLWRSGFMVPRHLYDFDRWMRTGFPVPSSSAVKWKVLERFGLGEIWIESGTHLGETAAFLSSISTHTYSIEPEPNLAKKAKSLLKSNHKVTIIEGISEEVLPTLLDSICDGSKPNLSFWLDGHYSKDMSAFKGPSDTPIKQELDSIAAHLESIGDVAILIDDMRCFDPQTVEFASYPKKSYLVEWAEDHNLFWTIEHDIFIATSRPTPPFLFL
jgi:hypothetical protein